MKDRVRINNQIRAAELRVISEDGSNLGIMSFGDALAKAENTGLDLIEISDKAVPPIAKIMDYGKFQYLENKKSKTAKAGNRAPETKSVQVKIGTGDHDLELKAKMASRFLADGDRVRINLYLRGRAKYLEPAFLRERLERVLRLITEEYKKVEDIKNGPNGLTLLIERAKK